VRCSELHADFLAGYFVGKMRRKNNSYPAIGVLQTLWPLGDSALTSEDHHGRREERGDSVRRGFEAGWRDNETLASAIETGINFVRNL
jgi:uncharacterized protein